MQNDGEFRRSAHELAGRFWLSEQRRLENTIECGRVLVIARAQLGTREFAKFLNRFDLCEEQARALEDLADKFGGDLAGPVRGSFALAAAFALSPAGVESALGKAIALARSGQRISHAVAAELLGQREEITE